MQRATQAILRKPGLDFAAGLTTSDLGAPDPSLALAQHDAYAAALRSLGLQLELLAALPGFADACFVEDVAVVTPRLAVITRPGAPSRLGEIEAIIPVLARHRPLARIEAPGTLEGGDVLVMDRTVLVGLSTRTNSSGAAQLKALLTPQGYETLFIPVVAGLHLKSSVTWLGRDQLLVSDRFQSVPELRAFPSVIADADEEPASSVLYLNGSLLIPAGYPKTRRKLDSTGLPLIELPITEFTKMDGGLTCLSLRF